MKNSREAVLRRQMITAGKKLADARLLTARAGNLSARLDPGHILITATGSSLADLKVRDIVKVKLKDNSFGKTSLRPSSELPSHSLIHQRLGWPAVIHCHPPLSNAYFAVEPGLKLLTFETGYYLKDVSVLKQTGINVRDPSALVSALKRNRLCVLRNHGVFSVGENFSQALEPVLVLEESAKVAAVARLFKKRALDRIDRKIKKCLLRRK